MVPSPTAEAMVIAPSNAIHTLGMKFPIDVAFRAPRRPHFEVRTGGSTVADGRGAARVCRHRAACGRL